MENKDIFNDSQNNFSKEEEINHAQNYKGGSQSLQDMQEELPNQTQADDSKKEVDARQSENTQTKAENGESPLQSDNITEYIWNPNESSVYHFKPDNMREYIGTRPEEHSIPYAYSSEPAAPTNTKKRKSKGKIILLAIAVVLWLAFMFVAVNVVGHYVFRNKESTIGPNINSDSNSNEKVNINRDENPIEVIVTPQDGDRTELTRIEVVDMVSDAVVEITTSTVQTNSFFGGNYVTSGAGSGVIIAQSDRYAYIVTNYHVIDGASTVKVTCTDNTVIEAEYLDGDVNNDIAMLRIQTDKKFPEIVIGSSDGLKVGQDIVVIGNPLGQLGGTVTEGIVSALDRKISVDGITMSLIQTSAAVNPGNSGGGMFNMAGQLVGIVNAKQSAEGIEGLGFAIPIDRVYDILVEIIENNYIKGRPTLGIEVKYVNDKWVSRIEYGVNTTGIFVTSSDNDKIQARDLIYSIDGNIITDASSYVAAVSSLTVGETVTVEVYRRGRLMQIDVEVAEYVPSGMFG